jgi:predicted secreted protein
MNSGTLRDKINALSIYIRDNPNSTIASVENLLNMVISH